jgi:hypothetical protein
VAVAALLTLVSGALMMLAGYAVAEWGWGLASLISTVGGVVILAAFAAARR